LPKLEKHWEGAYRIFVITSTKDLAALFSTLVALILTR
jgi:hypothetical protein